MQMIELKVPDIGDFKDVEVIEVLVKVGDVIEAEQSLITIESDKASMEIPASHGGTIKEIKVKLGDKLNEGSVLATVEAAKSDKPAASLGEGGQGGGEKPTVPTSSPPSRPFPIKGEGDKPTGGRAHENGAGAGALIEVKVPDIGDFKDVEIIEVLVKPGDTIAAEQSLLTIESDKASMEIPSSAAGIVKELKVKLGDKINQGTVIAVVESGPDTQAASGAAESASEGLLSTAAAEVGHGAEQPPAGGPDPSGAVISTAQAAPASRKPELGPGRTHPVPEEIREVGDQTIPHASPSVRKFARELGVDLHLVRGSGPKERITQEDVQGYVKAAIAQAPSGKRETGAADGSGFGAHWPAWPSLDFSKFGATETVKLSRIRKISGPNLARNWATMPHVTQFDEADVTELEEFRKSTNEAFAKQGKKDAPPPKVTMLAFVMKACVAALAKYPHFNSSLDAEGANLIVKKYYHIGFAADTPNGLVVPVLKDCDKKGIAQLAKETAELAAKARDGKLSPTEMQGASFTISSLGGVGGTAFTPIINAPEVAILGLSKSDIKPKWDGVAFQPRLMLPLSLSYDHRVIDGAQAARFTTYLGEVLADMRRVLL